jgi:small-conductance mechanosensitive channel
MQGLQGLLGPHVWIGYLGRALQGLLLAIPVAVLFEVAGWLIRRWVLKQLGGAMARDAHREPVERARRRRALRDSTVVGIRWIWNTIAIAVILTLWRVEPVAVGLVLLALTAVFWPLLRELVAGWLLLLDDCLAPGDEVLLNGDLRGTVAETTLRRWRLEDAEGRSLWIASSRIQSVLHLSRRSRTGEPERPHGG